MKKYMLFIGALGLLVVKAEAQQSEGKLKSARKDIVVAQADLQQAKKDSIAEYRQFKQESLAKIEENNKTIESLRIKREEKEKESRNEYNKKVKALESKNYALKESVINYRADGNTNWVVFKREFNSQMDSLRESFIESRD